MQIKYLALFLVFSILLIIGCSHNQGKKSPTFFLKNLKSSPLKVNILRNNKCEPIMLEPSQVIELGQAFFLKKILIKFPDENSLYSYDTSILLPFYHWSFIYDWKVFLGIDKTKNILLLDNALSLNYDNQPVNRDFPIKGFKQEKITMNCQ